MFEKMVGTEKHEYEKCYKEKPFHKMVRMNGTDSNNRVTKKNMAKHSIEPTVKMKNSE